MAKNRIQITFLIFGIIIIYSFTINSDNNLLLSKIKTDKEEYSLTDAIKISYSLQNISQKQVSVWHCGFGCNNKIIVKDEAGEELKLTSLGQNVRKAFSPGGMRLKNFDINLKPNQIDSMFEKYNLKNYFLFENSGKYFVQYEYNEIAFKQEVRVMSNQLEIIIK